MVVTSTNVPINQATLPPPHLICRPITSPDDLPTSPALASDSWVLVSYKRAKRAKSIPINTNTKNAHFLSKKSRDTDLYMLHSDRCLCCYGKGHMGRECRDGIICYKCSKIPCLQYANNTIILLPPDFTSIKRVKILIYTFELLSGLSINFQKSSIYLLGPLPLDSS